jgi:plastocyanin
VPGVAPFPSAPASRARRAGRARRGARAGAALAAALLCAVPLAARAEPAGVARPARVAEAAAAGSGAVRGGVVVLRKPLFGGLEPAEDASGVLVYVTGFASDPPVEQALLHQRDKTFEPRVLPVVSGQRVRFPNHDDIYHNVFSVSPVQPFDLGQYKASDPPKEVAFERAGLVPVYCNIHPQMLSYVVVLENGAFATTGPDGSFAIEGLPAGELVVNAWLPGAQRASQPVRVEPGGAAEVRLELRQTEKIGPHKRKDGTPYPRKSSGKYEGG